jgi:hypothetical protein
VKGGMFLGGYLQICIDTRLDLKITLFSKGLIEKRPYLLQPPVWGRTEARVAQKQDAKQRDEC